MKRRGRAEARALPAGRTRAAGPTGPAWQPGLPSAGSPVAKRGVPGLTRALAEQNAALSAAIAARGGGQLLRTARAGRPAAPGAAPRSPRAPAGGGAAGRGRSRARRPPGPRDAASPFPPPPPPLCRSYAGGGAGPRAAPRGSALGRAVSRRLSSRRGVERHRLPLSPTAGGPPVPAAAPCPPPPWSGGWRWPPCWC